MPCIVDPNSCIVDPNYSYRSEDEYRKVVADLNKATRAYEVLKLKDKNRKLEEMNLLLQKRLVNLIHYTAIRLNDKGEDFLKNFFAINKPDLLPFLAHQKRLKDLKAPYFTVDLVGNWTLVDVVLHPALQKALDLTAGLSEEDKLALIERLKG